MLVLVPRTGEIAVVAAALKQAHLRLEDQPLIGVGRLGDVGGERVCERRAEHIGVIVDERPQLLFGDSAVQPRGGHLQLALRFGRLHLLQEVGVGGCLRPRSSGELFDGCCRIG